MPRKKKIQQTKNNFYEDGKRKKVHNTKLDEFVADLGYGEVEPRISKHVRGIADEDEAIYVYRSPKTWLVIEKSSKYWGVAKIVVKDNIKNIERVYFGDDRAMALSTVRKLRNS